MDPSGLKWTKQTEMDQLNQSELKWTEVGGMGRSRPKQVDWIEVDRKKLRAQQL